MNKQIVLLRGINVSGQKKIPMADLRNWLAELPVTNLETYIQSGNVVLSSSIDNELLSASVRQKIFDKSRFDVEVITISSDILRKVIDGNPFAERTQNGQQVYVSFFNQEPSTTKVKALLENCPPNESLYFANTHLYFYSDEGYGQAKMNNNYLEKKLQVVCTTRNWKTVETLLNMSS